MPGNKPCEPGCDCRKHHPAVRLCPDGCTCGRHRGSPKRAATDGGRDPEQRRQYAREYRARNPEKVSEANRRYREENAEYMRERNRQWRAANPDKALVSHLQRRHDMSVDDWQAMWDKQGGRCYLCADPMDGIKAVIEHDHACCPSNRSCAGCRRGLACASCNKVVGFARDNAARLTRIAANFGRAADDAAARIAGAVPSNVTPIRREATG